MVMLSMAGYAVVALWGGVYAATPRLFLIAWVMHSVLAGCYITSTASLGLRLFPHSRFAQFASASGVFVSIANMVLAPAVGTLIDTTEKNYRLTFFAGCGLALLSLGVAFYVHWRFRKLGGPANYVAPE
jgi:MFS family permease